MANYSTMMFLWTEEIYCDSEFGRCFYTSLILCHIFMWYTRSYTVQIVWCFVIWNVIHQSTSKKYKSLTIYDLHAWDVYKKLRNYITNRCRDSRHWLMSHLATVLAPTSHKIYIFQIRSLGLMAVVSCIGNNCVMKIVNHFISYWIPHPTNHWDDVTSYASMWFQWWL